MDAAPRRVCLGQLAGAHGVRGLVRVRSFAQRPRDLEAYGPLTDESGQRQFELTVTGVVKGEMLLAEIEGVASREAAQALSGTRLFVERKRLPPAEEGEFYHADLVGLAVEDPDGRPLGRVTAVVNHGAGDLLEIAGPAGELVLPFTRATVPEVDLAGGRLIARPPEEVVAESRPEGAGRPEGES
ncbi:MAG: ribosome maturation factor RimM [Kiloniellales bacterium]